MKQLLLLKFSRLNSHDECSHPQGPPSVRGPVLAATLGRPLRPRPGTPTSLSRCHISPFSNETLALAIACSREKTNFKFLSTFFFTHSTYPLTMYYLQSLHCTAQRARVPEALRRLKENMLAEDDPRARLEAYSGGSVGGGSVRKDRPPPPSQRPASGTAAQVGARIIMKR